MPRQPGRGGTGGLAIEMGGREAGLWYTWCPAPGDLHVELHRVHAQDGVPHVAEQVACRHHPGEGRQLGQLLELQLPPVERQGVGLAQEVVRVDL